MFKHINWKRYIGRWLLQLLTDAMLEEIEPSNAECAFEY
jgi:hypothetical protein